MMVWFCLLLLSIIIVEIVAWMPATRFRSIVGTGARSLVMMPTLLVQTSAALPNGKKRTALLKEVSSSVASNLRKPEAYVMISLKQSDAMMFAGRLRYIARLYMDTPTAHLYLYINNSAAPAL